VESAVKYTYGSITGQPGPPADYDVRLIPQKSVEIAQQVVDILRERGVCVIKAGADRAFQKAVYSEAKTLWEIGEFQEAMRGQPVMPGSNQVNYRPRDDRVVWMTQDWCAKNEKHCRALKVLDSQLHGFGFGLGKIFEEQLGVPLKQRTCGMLSCYSGEAVPGAKYDFHVDNPYQTQMGTPDDKRRLTVIYYISDAPWDVEKDGGALQVCLSNPRRAPRTTTEALQSDTVTIASSPDTLVAFFSHTMYHAVLPLVSTRTRFALSSWFQTV